MPYRFLIDDAGYKVPPNITRHNTCGIYTLHFMEGSDRVNRRDGILRRKDNGCERFRLSILLEIGNGISKIGKLDII
ncbi:MAG: hypothetical protein ACTSUK_09040 [Promethearchaeota archaeon]